MRHPRLPHGRRLRRGRTTPPATQAYRPAKAWRYPNGVRHAWGRGKRTMEKKRKDPARRECEDAGDRDAAYGVRSPGTAHSPGAGRPKTAASRRPKTAASRRPKTAASRRPMTAAPRRLRRGGEDNAAPGRRTPYEEEAPRRLRRGGEDNAAPGRRTPGEKEEEAPRRLRRGGGEDAVPGHRSPYEAAPRRLRRGGEDNAVPGHRTP